MAVAYDNSVTVHGFGVTTLTTASFTVGSRAKRAALIGLDLVSQSTTGGTASLGGVSGTIIKDFTDATAQQRLVLLSVTEPPSGSQTATASWTTSCSASLGVVTASGVDQNNPFNNSTTGTAPFGASGSLAVTSNPGDLTCTLSGTGIANGGQTTNQTLRNADFGSMDTGPGTGTTTHTWTDGSNTAWIFVGANFVQAGASVAYDNSVTVSGTGVTSLTSAAFTISGVNRAAILGVMLAQQTPAGLTCSLGGVSGVAISGAVGSDSGAGGISTTLFGVKSPPSGSQTATASWTGAASASLGVVTARNVDQNTGFNNGGGVDGGITASVSESVTSKEGDLTCSLSGSGSFAGNQTTNQTLRTQSYGSMDTGPGTGTTTHTWSMTSTQMVMAGANFMAAPAGVKFDGVATGKTTAAGTSIPNFTLNIGTWIDNGAVLVGLSFTSKSVSGVTVTIGGTAASLVSGTDTGSGGSNSYRSMIYGLATGALTGAVTISVSWTGSASAVAGAVSVSHVNQTTPFKNGTAVQGAVGGAGTPQPSISVTSAPGDLTFDNVVDESGSGVGSSQSNQTFRYSTQDGTFAISGSGSTDQGAATITDGWNSFANFHSWDISACDIAALWPTIQCVNHTFIYTSSGNFGSPATVDMTGATLLVAFVSNSVDTGGSATSAPTDSSSNTWVSAGAQTGVNGQLSQIYYVTNPTVTSAMTFTNSNAHGSVLIAGFSGTSNNLDGHSGNYSTSTVSSLQPGSLTPSGTEIFFSGAQNPNDATHVLTADSGFTVLDQPNQFTPGTSSAYLISGTAENPTWFANGGAIPLTVVMATFKVSSGGPTPSTRLGLFDRTLAMPAWFDATLAGLGYDNQQMIGYGWQDLLTETHTYSESLTRLTAETRGPSDTLTESEALARLVASPRSLTDTLSESDALARLVASTRGITDTDSFSESLTRIAGKNRTATDTLSFSDTAARLIAIHPALTDTLTFSETLARLVAQTRAITDTKAFSDTVTGQRGVARSATDTVSFSDAIARALTLSRVFSDTLSFSEALARNTAAARALVDTVSFSEALTRLMGAVRAVTDTYAASDTASRSPQAFARIASDAYAAADTLARSVAITRATIDTLSESDSGSGSSSNHGHSAIDTFAFSESVVRVVTFVRLITDTAKVLEGANMNTLQSAQLWEAAQNVIKESTIDSLVTGAIWSAGQGVSGAGAAASAWQAVQPVVPRREQD